MAMKLRQLLGTPGDPAFDRRGSLSSQPREGGPTSTGGGPSPAPDLLRMAVARYQRQYGLMYQMLHPEGDTAAPSFARGSPAFWASADQFCRQQLSLPRRDGKERKSSVYYGNVSNAVTPATSHLDSADGKPPQSVALLNDSDDDMERSSDDDEILLANTANRQLGGKKDARSPGARPLNLDDPGNHHSRVAWLDYPSMALPKFSDTIAGEEVLSQQEELALLIRRREELPPLVAKDLRDDERRKRLLYERMRKVELNRYHEKFSQILNELRESGPALKSSMKLEPKPAEIAKATELRLLQRAMDWKKKRKRREERQQDDAAPMYTTSLAPSLSRRY